MQINPDGVSVKGCSMIYAPKGQAGEYAPLACNPYRGCGTGCKYCYVSLVLHMDRAEFNAGAVPRENFIAALTKDARKYQAAGIREQVMFSFTTDMYNPSDTSLTRPSMEIVQAHGLGICILTKGGSRALRDLDLFRPDRDAFASTLTSLDDDFSRKWERRAALPGDRIATLRRFHDAGIFTWVSLEPVIDTEASKQIIRETHGFVDLYKIGRANYIGLTKTTDWRRFTGEILDVLHHLGARHYIKQDLQPYLSAGYPNVRRVQQFHASKESE
jgi:DNA repair photolyase